MKIITKSNKENWEVCKELEEKGFTKIADCFWYKIFIKDDNKIVVQLDYVI
jgi:hypothetical protein